jgi:hypothetical protein
VVTFLSLDPLLGVCKPAGTHVYIEFLCWVILSYAELYWVMLSYTELYHVYDLRIYWCRVCVDTMQGLTCVCTCCSVGSVHPQHSQ